MPFVLRYTYTLNDRVFNFKTTLFKTVDNFNIIEENNFSSMGSNLLENFMFYNICVEII